MAWVSRVLIHLSRCSAHCTRSQAHTQYILLHTSQWQQADVQSSSLMVVTSLLLDDQHCLSLYHTEQVLSSANRRAL
jgi:hypothetical protein